MKYFMFTFIVLFMCIPWFTHIIMSYTSKEYPKYLTGMRNFIHVFTHCNGLIYIDMRYSKSIFIKNIDDEWKYDCYIHAGLIMVNNKYLVFHNPIEYYIFLIWKGEYIHNIHKALNI